MKTTVFFLLSFLLIANNTATAQNPGFSCFNKAQKLIAQAKINQAIICYDSAANFFLKNNDTLNYLITIYSETSPLIQTSNLSKAQINLLNAYNLVKNSQYFNSKITILLLNQMGQVQAMFGRPDSALSIFQNSLNLYKKINSPEPKLLADIYGNIGNIYLQQGFIPQALNYLHKTTQIYYTINDTLNPNFLNAFLNISIAYIQQNQYSNALKILNNLLKTYQKFYPKSINIAKILENIALIYYDQNQPNLALKYYFQAYNLISKILGLNNLEIAALYNSIGSTYLKLNQLNQALQYFSAAYKIYSKLTPPSNPDLLALINNISLIYKKLGNYGMAIFYYQNILKQLKHSNLNPVEIPITLSNIASVYFSFGKLDSAQKYYSLAINQFKKLNFLHNTFLIIPYLNLGSLYLHKNQYSTALLFFQKALQTNIPSFNPTSPLQNPFANSNFLNGIKLIETLNKKAQTLLKIYQITDSILYLTAAYNTYILIDSVMQKLRNSALSDDDKMLLEQKSHSIYEYAIFTSLAMSSKFPKQKNFYYNSALSFAERNKAALLSAAISAKKTYQLANIPDSIITQISSLKKQILSLKTQLAKAISISQQDSISSLLFNLQNNLDQLQTKIKHCYPKYQKILSSTYPVSINILQKNLKPNQAIISYFYGQNNLFLFLITKDTIIIGSSPIKNLSELILKYSNLLRSDSTNPQTFAKISYQIAKSILPPYIPSYISHLIIIPDDILNLIPFETIILDSNYSNKNFSSLNYIIKKFSISYAYSSRLFLQLKHDSIAAKLDFIGFAPGFSNFTQTFNGSVVPPIPGSIQELKNIASVFSSHQLYYKTLFDTSATETKFKTLNLNNFKIIHLATHAFTFSSNPNQSAIIFAKSTTDDGILYMPEIYTLNLNSLLITLSACQTGLGKLSKGEGIIGLTRAFIIAGAKNIIASLWKVADQPTANLMTTFYSQLLNLYPQINNSTSFALALRNAKLNMINSHKLSNPYYWAAFILIGQ